MLGKEWTYHPGSLCARERPALCEERIDAGQDSSLGAVGDRTQIGSSGDSDGGDRGNGGSWADGRCYVDDVDRVNDSQTS
jgi:hypothetical protein